MLTYTVLCPQSFERLNKLFCKMKFKSKTGTVKKLSPPVASTQKNVNSIGRSFYSGFPADIHISLCRGICMAWSKQLGVCLTSKLGEQYPEDLKGVWYNTGFQGGLMQQSVLGT